MPEPKVFLKNIAQNIILALCAMCYLMFPLQMRDRGQHGTAAYLVCGNTAPYTAHCDALCVLTIFYYSQK